MKRPFAVSTTQCPLSRRMSSTGDVALNACARLRGHLGHGIGGQRRIDVAIVGLVDSADQPIELRQRVELCDAGRTHDLERIACESGKAGDMPELVHPVRIARHAHGTRAVKAAALAGFLRKDVAIEANRGGPQFLDRRVVREVCTEARRMPGGAMGQVVLLD